MSGKPYNIGEMKIIVDYLVENKLYGEIKARKMWMDFANTKHTTRTWQSLKETFLKRILPDIHNPYFKLTNEQISSFKARCDLADRNKNKLEIQTISDESSSNDNNQKDNEPLNYEGETTAGENIKSSMIATRTRSSADTIILDNCYETAEEIQRELESKDDEKPAAKCKSLRDCITYSEPLTPMLQEVLDDFASEPEDSDRECRMEIVECGPENDNTEVTDQPPELNNEESTTKAATDVAKNAEGLPSEAVEEVLAQLEGGIQAANKSNKTSDLPADSEELPTEVLGDEISSMHAEHGTERVDEAEDETQGATKYLTAENTNKTVDKVKDTENAEVSAAEKSNSEPQVQSGNLNTSNSTVDASLPNNPEALKNKNPKIIEANHKEASEKAASNSTEVTKDPLPATRKRSSSQDNLKTIENKKKKLNTKLQLKSKKTDSESHLVENGEDEQPKDKEKLNKTETRKKLDSVNKAPDHNKPSTSYENNVAEVIDLENENGRNEQAEITNPCLQNVSLFDEQFHKTKYNMSESSDTEQNKKETQIDTQETAVTKDNDVVMLKSYSDSDTVEVQTTHRKKPRAGVLSSKSERDKAIANMFGFTSGGVGSKRKRQLSRRRRTISHNNNVSHHNAAVSNSSDWTSESESDAFVSPPRGRRNRNTRKYLRPKAGKILSLEEEGGLFVMYGKKIYPLVKDGKIVKNYITYLPESDSDEGESFWKQKYVDEKKKAAELKRLLEQANDPPSRDTKSPILQASPLRKASTSHNQGGESTSNDVGKEICLPKSEEQKQEKVFQPPEKIKIKFTRNNDEVHLEGHWPQIHPVLEQVVQIFHKEAEPSVSDSKSKIMAVQPANSKEPSSGVSTPIIITPVDPEVHEKVDEIEKEIFKEIEERDREEENVPNEVSVNGANVTKRKLGRPRNSSLSVPSPKKQPKTSNGPQINESEDIGRTRRQKAKKTEDKSIDNEENVSKRQTRTPRKVLNETLNTSESKTIQTRRSKQSLDTSRNNDEDELRYMLPPRSRRQSLKSNRDKKTNEKPHKSAEIIPKMVSSPDNFSLNSMDSTQGYQDSDPNPIETKKKKKMDVSSFIIKTRNSLRRSTRRKSHPYAYRNSYEDSSNSSADVSVKIIARENSSATSEPYRSESFQLLMPRATHSRNRLESIDEITSINNESYFKHLESTSKNNNEISIHTRNLTSPSGQITSDIGSSSNVSLPMSPELSLVENMSISKDLLNNIEDFPTINETQNNNVHEPTVSNNYMLSEVDVSVPLMRQEFVFESCNTMMQVSPESKSLVTESLLKKIDTFNIKDQTAETAAADTIDKRLHDMLLDSAKKMTRSQSKPMKDSMMEVDVTSAEVQKKAKTKKRCSTPQKKKVTKKSLAPKVDPVVEEEHVESCSHSGRKSCPPLLQTNFDKNGNNEEVNIAQLSLMEEKPKGRKKKDIIRVKIQRPKNKRAQEKLRTKSTKDTSKISVFTDSGINDTESELFLPANESIDLIHNHSETCLNANECVGDSVEFVENSKSVISLGDSMQSGDNTWNRRSANKDEHSTSPDVFCNNAQDVSFYQKTNSDNIEDTNDTVYLSPLGTEMSANSLITEDLSDDAPQKPVRPSKWYLLAEDETNTNIEHPCSQFNMLSGTTSGFGSNLKELFPITCAIPDLSTITEMSKENDNSRKPTLGELDGLTADDFNSHSIFDSNF